jgi:3-hydroxybutyrate dehydrogenase
LSDRNNNSVSVDRRAVIAEVGTPLRGYHAVVTGASGGIGAETAATIARLGAHVTLMGRNERALAGAAARLRQNYPIKVQFVAVDVCDEDRVVAAFETARDEFGAPKILVNNAGIAEAAPFRDTDSKFWQRLIDVDLTGPFLCTRQVFGAMLKGGYGRIVNIASTAGRTGYSYVTAYCAAKHGLIGLTRALAREFAKSGVTVNAVCPGYTDTNIVASTIDNIVAKTGRSREQVLAQLVSHNPQGRLITPTEVAETVGWLCLPSSASVTGQSIMVDGGELM